MLVGVAAIRAMLVLAVVVTGGRVVLVLALASIVLLSPVLGAVLGAARMLRVPHELFGRITGAMSFIATSLQPGAPLLAGLLLASLSQCVVLIALVVAFGAVTLFAAVVPGFGPDPEGASERSSD